MHVFTIGGAIWPTFDASKKEKEGGSGEFQYILGKEVRRFKKSANLLP